jgi:hypothetical protein
METVIDEMWRALDVAEAPIMSMQKEWELVDFLFAR